MGWLAWLALPIAGVAATVRGGLLAPDYADGTMVRAGYLGRTADGAFVTNHAGFTIGSGSRSARSDTFRPRTTEIRSDVSGRFVFEHRGLPAGQYVFYAQVGGSRLAWKVLRVGTSTDATVDLSIRLSERGALRILVPSRDESEVWLQPCREDGRPLLPGLSLDAWHVEGRAAGGAVLFDDLEPGWYRAALFGRKNVVRTESGSSSVLELVGSWLVRVERGKTLRVDLPAR